MSQSGEVITVTEAREVGTVVAEKRESAASPIKENPHYQEGAADETGAARDAKGEVAKVIKLDLSGTAVGDPSFQRTSLKVDGPLPSEGVTVSVVYSLTISDGGDITARAPQGVVLHHGAGLFSVNGDGKGDMGVIGKDRADPTTLAVRSGAGGAPAHHLLIERVDGTPTAVWKGLDLGKLGKATVIEIK